MSESNAGAGMSDLLEIMARLRDPERGCPWDLQQDFASIAPHTLEECYELIDAIERGDTDDIAGELGDLLFQVVFYAQLGVEQGLFDFDSVVASLAEKLRRRHPHVFGAEAGEVDVAAVSARWEAIKVAERAGRDRSGLLDDVPLALPALSRAAKLQRRAARVGFDWNDWRGALAKLQEELEELQAAMQGPGQGGEREEEFGDLLFACVNLARHLAVEPESALRAANRKFERRFHYIEEALSQRGLDPEGACLEDMDALWDEAKARGL